MLLFDRVFFAFGGGDFVEERGVFLVGLDGGFVVVEAGEAGIDGGDVFLERAAGRGVLGLPRFHAVDAGGLLREGSGERLFGRGNLRHPPPRLIGGSVEALQSDHGRERGIHVVSLPLITVDC